MIDQSQLRGALSNQKSYGGRLGTILVKMGFLRELDMLKFLSKQLSLPMVDLYKVAVEQKMIDLIPYDVAGKYNVLPLTIKVVSGKPLLYLAMSDPTNLEAIDSIQFTAGYKIQPVLALDSSLTDFINFYYKGKQIPKQTMDIPMTERDEALSPETGQSTGFGTLYGPGLSSTTANVPQPGPDAGREAGGPERQPDRQYSRLLPFIRAIVALLIKKGVVTAEEFKQALTDEYKKR
ncbi:MAG: hypothetical protein M1517_04470 [Deltaproteobacteria bacterium]|nr:hypothetical protein [Deltaproteobacteria bacterium]